MIIFLFKNKNQCMGVIMVVVIIDYIDYKKWEGFVNC